MFKTAFYDTRKSTIHVWEQVSGKNLYDSFHWTPYVFKEANDGNIKTITGLQTEKVSFNTYSDYYNYCKENNNVYENRVHPPEIQFLSERYHRIPDDEIDAPKLKIYAVDIEVHVNKTDKGKMIKIRKKIK